MLTSNSSNKYIGAALISAVAFFGAIAPASAETINCTPITSVPYTISTSGVYCLTGNLTTSITSGSAISINTSNVTLDMNGFSIDGTSAGSASVAHGILASGAKENITVRNGTVSGFLRGVTVSTPTAGRVDSSGHLIEDLKISNSLLTGILVSATGTIVRNNIVNETGGSTVYPAFTLHGIYFDGAGNLADNNIVQGTDATIASNAGARGIAVVGSSGTVLRGNSVTRTIGPGAVGIHSFSGGAMLIRDNEVSDATAYGVVFDTTSDKYMSTITHNVGTAYLRGKAVGANN